MEQKRERELKAINYVGYGMGSLGSALMSVMMVTYLTMYLTNVALLDIAAVSAILAVSKVFDGISDVIIGNIVDNTRSRFGRARVWLLRISLPLAFAMLLLFWMPPQLSGPARYVYVFIMYNIVNTVCVTFLNISELSLISLMTRDDTEHGLLANVEAATKNLGIIIGSSLFVKLLTAFSDKPGEQNTQRGYTVAVLIFCIFMIAANLIRVFTTKETEEGGASSSNKEKKSIKKDLAELSIVITDKNWLVLFFVMMLNCMCMSLAATGAAYYALYKLGDMGQMSWILVTQTAPGLIILFFTPFLMKRFGKNRLIRAAVILLIVGSAGFGIVAPAKIGMIAFNIIKGLGLGMLSCMMFGLTADVAETIRIKKGKTVAGVSFAGISAGDKLGSGIGNVVFGAVMAAAGFNGALKVQPPEVVTASTWMFIWSQVIIFAVILVILVFVLDIGRDDGKVAGLTTALPDDKN